MSHELENVISAFDAAKSSDKEWRGKCPQCGHNSLLISVGKKLPVAGWCSRGCDTKAVNAAVYKAAGISFEPFTVARFCEMKKLPEAWVTAHFALHEQYGNPKTKKWTPAVGFPYIGPPRITRTDTTESCERPYGGIKFRFSENSHRTAWQHYTQPMLYGLHMLPYYKANGIALQNIVLVEGESDTITLAYRGIAAFGISGAPNGWKDTFAKEPVLQNAKRIIVVQEPRKPGAPIDAGKELVEKITASFQPGKLWVIEFGIGKLPKDPSALWINSNNIEEFTTAWKQAVATAKPANVEQPAVLPETDEPEIASEQDSFPEFPRLPGSLGKLVEAIHPDLPYEHKAMAALAFIGLELAGRPAGRVKLVTDPWLESRFFVKNIGLPGSGKTAAIEEVRKAVKTITPTVHMEPSMDSAPALIETLATPGQNVLMLFPDELKDLFEKSRSTGSSKNSMFNEILKLYELTYTSNRTKSGGLVPVNDAHLSIIGGTTVSGAEQMWQCTGGAGSGLQSRFVGGFSDKKIPNNRTLSNESLVAEALAELKPFVCPASGSNNEEDETAIASDCRLLLSTAAQELIGAWSNSLVETAPEKMARVMDMGKRFAMVITVCNGESEITGDTMRLALQFVDYQVAFRDKFFPADSAGNLQAFENRIRGFFKLNPEATERQVRNSIKPERHPGGFDCFTRAFAVLMRAEVLKPVALTRKKKAIFAMDYEG